MNKDVVYEVLIDRIHLFNGFQYFMFLYRWRREWCRRYNSSV